MDSKTKVTFWLYKAKKNSKNLIPIYLRVWQDYKYFTKSTGLFTKQSMWDRKSMQIKGKGDEAIATNSQLMSLRHKVIQIINQLTITGKPFDVEVIKKQMEGSEEHQMSLLRVYDKYLALMRKMEGKEYAKATITKYANTRLRLSQYMKHHLKRKDIYLYELNYDFMREFELFLRDKFDNSTTTCYKHYQRFTRVLHVAMQKGYMDRHPFPEYKLRMPRKKIEFLDKAELAKLENTDFKIERLNNIRDIFVFCCYTGLAYAEVEKLSMDDVTTGIDGEKWLNVLRKKTHKHYQVPLLPQAMDIMLKYKINPKCVANNRVLLVPSNVKYNAYLKEIAQIVGISKNLTTHIARKTFATTVMLGNGCNIGVVSKLLGHASVQVTLDSYGAYNDELVLSDIGKIRGKLTKKTSDNITSGIIYKNEKLLEHVGEDINLN